MSSDYEDKYRRVSSESSGHEEDGLEKQNVPFLQNSKSEGEQEISHVSKRAAFLLAVFCFIASLGIFWTGLRWPVNKIKCSRQFSSWSPMLEAIDVESKRLRLEPESPYLGNPTTELETAWDALWQYGSVGIPDDKLVLLNKSRDVDWHRVEPELGGGVEGFFEGFHQIHCLNLIRQYAFREDFDYKNLPAFDKTPELLVDHVYHCIETIRINIECAADTTPLPLLRNSDGKFSMWSNAEYSCRKFETLVDWANDHVVHPYNGTEERIKYHEVHGS